jgi:hypothetical protein
MAELEKPVLSDPGIKPDDKLISSFIGDKINYWHDILTYCETEYSGASGDWRFYNDGKQWLFKFVFKKKTLFWAALYEDAFKITSYFGDKAEPVILASNISDPVKEGFINGKRYGKIRAISLKIFRAEDVENVKKVIAVKAKLK